MSPPSKDTSSSELLLNRLSEGLDGTTKMVQSLLSDLKDSEIDFASMKTELNILKDNVKGLSEVIRDGGTGSILTRCALIEQNVDNIKKWMDNHVDIHQRVKRDFTEFRNQLQDIEHRLAHLEEIAKADEEAEKEAEKEKKANEDREKDLEHEHKKNEEKIKAERTSALVKIISTILIGIMGLVGGYFANAITKAVGVNLSTPTTSISAPAPTLSAKVPQPIPALPTPAPSSNPASSSPVQKP